MPHSFHPGDVLAGRYRLVDLLVESGSGRFWRAHDLVLDRHVALHTIAADDGRSQALLDAARASTTVIDRRILRVLDAAVLQEVCYVVNEWGSGVSLDILIGGGQVLSPRHAAWLVAQVSATVARAHAAGIAHGRLAPENILIDRHGEVRVIGFCVDAALHGVPFDRTSTDLADLAGLLYCGLTGTWAGASRSDVRRAPREHGHVLRPRRVRAGVPRPLDQMCNLVLHPHASSRGQIEVSAAGIEEHLRDFVGDDTGVPEALVATLPPVRERFPVSLPPLPDLLPHDSGASDPGPRSTGSPDATATADSADSADSEVTRKVEVASADEVTQAVATTQTTTQATAQAEAATRRVETAAASDEVTGVVEVTAAVETGAHEPGAETGGPGDPADAEDTADAVLGALEADEGLASDDGLAAVETDDDPPPSERDHRSVVGDVPTEASLPALGEKGPSRSRRPSPGPPPPPFAEPPPRPLFAPEPADGGPVRRPRHPDRSQPTTAGAVSTGSVPRSGAPGDSAAYWPWETGSANAARGATPGAAPGDSAVLPAVSEPVPGRNWLRLGVVLGVVTLLVLGAIVTYNLGRGRTPLGAEPGQTSPAPTAPTSAPAPVALTGVTATDLDPQGNGSESPEETGNAVDGDPDTAWSTVTYFQQLGPAGIKTGLGLSLDLGSEQEVSQVDLSFLGTPSAATLYAADEAPSAVDGLTAVGEVEDAGEEESVALEDPVTTRYLVVWLTSLPPTDGGFSGGLREVVVLGG